MRVPAFFHSFMVDFPVYVAQLWKMNLKGSEGFRMAGMDSLILLINLLALS